MEDPVRVRVVFEDRHILTKSQRSEGLKRCLIRLNPDLATISDLASHLIHTFSLQQSSPYGLVLSMDDFVLPPFESSCILKDKDIIRVKKKCATVMDVIEIGDDIHHIQDSEIVEKQHILPSNALLAIREFQGDPEGHNSNDEEDAHARKENAIGTGTPSSEKRKPKRKRKHSDKLQRSKKKKLKLASLEKPVITVEGDENIHLEQNLNCYKKKGSPQKRLKRLDNGDGREDTLITSQLDDNVEKITSSVQREERNDQVEENSQRDTCKPHANGSGKKAHSRSARRKQVKRKWWQVMAKMERQMQANDMHKTSPEHQKMDQNTEREEEIFPIVVRPGHIRFEPLDAEQSNRHSEAPMEIVDEVRKCNVYQHKIHRTCQHAEFFKFKETLQWNGTTSKKKGQKWGREKTIRKRIDANAYNEESNGKFIAEEGKTVNDHIDFESLFPLTRLPKEGDVVVYRLVELSNSLCPEVSPFRVGKVSSYDLISVRIILVPVPEFPIFSTERKDGEDFMLQLDDSPYKEDGSLEIDYPSLVDVRLLKANESEAATANYLGIEIGEEAAAPVNNWERALGNDNVREAIALPTENGQAMGWGEIKQALNEQRAKLMERNGGWDNWTPSKSTAATSWSYRALRGGALGPTVALLRGKNGKHGSK